MTDRQDGDMSFRAATPVTRRTLLTAMGTGPFVRDEDTIIGRARGKTAGPDPLFFSSRETARLVAWGATLTKRAPVIRVLGPLHTDFGGSGRAVLPYVDADGALKLLDGDGTIRRVVEPDGNVRPAGSRTRLAVDRWQGTASVFFVDDAYETIYRVTDDSGPTAVATPARGTQAVLGVADVDGIEVLVFVNADRRLKSLRPDGRTTRFGPARSPVVGSRGGLGAGAPVRFSEDGAVVVPIVTGDGALFIVGRDGTVRRITGPGTMAACAPLATADVDDDGELEIAFLTTENELGYVDDVTAGGSIEGIAGDVPEADERTGVVTTRDRSATSADVTAAERTATLYESIGPHARSVAFDGATALVGIPPAATPDGPPVGRAAVLVGTDRTWTQQATLSPDGDSGQFGTAVALDGTTAVVGASLGPDPTGAHAGSATVFTRVAGEWARQATLTTANAGGVDQFGTAVAVAGDTVIVGASADTAGRGDTTGSASVFTRTDGTWIRETTLVPEGDGIDQFGRAVALHRDTAIVGARRPDEGVLDNGVAFVFTRTDGCWTTQAELAPEGSHRDDGFGTALATDGETVVAGAPTETNARGPNAGAAHVFSWGAGEWRRQATLRDTYGTADRQLGTAVALDGDTALVGAEFGGPVVFTYSDGTWTRRTGLGSEADGSKTSSVLALSGGRAIVGVEGRAGRPDRTGRAVEVYEP